MKKTINIYGDITDYPLMDGDMSSSKLAQELDGDYDEIIVNINSFGGSVSEGISIYNQLKSHPAKVTTITDGFCCSIASIIFLAGDERKMFNSSAMFVHNAWTACQGNAQELREQAEVLEKLTQLSINIYCEKSELSEDEVKELLDNETWLDANEALELGFATEIIRDEVKAVAQSVKMSLISMIKEKCKPDDDKKKKSEVEDEIQEENEDVELESEPEVDEKCNPDDDKKKKKQSTELNAMSSFFNLIRKGEKKNDTWK